MPTIKLPRSNLSRGTITKRPIDFTKGRIDIKVPHSKTPIESKKITMYSIVVVNYNGGSKVVDCLESVFKNSESFELLFVDNGSTDGSDRIVAREFPTIRLTKNTTNLGFAKANNIGIMQANGDWIVLLNPDTLVTERWLEGLAKCAQIEAGIGIATPKLLRFDRKTIDSTGHIFEFKSAQARDRGSGEEDTGQYDRTEEILSCCFAAVLIKREVIRQIGMLDEKMVLYYEDVDYCLRARIQGWKIIYCPESVVLHARGGVTTSKSAGMQRRAVAYPLRIILKCYSKGNALRYGREKFSKYLVSMVAGAKNRDLQYFLTYLRAVYWNAFNLPVHARQKVQRERRAKDDEIIRLAAASVGGD